VWLKLPRLVCLPAQECLTSPSISLLEELARSSAWRGKYLRPESWRRVLKTGVFQTLLSGLTCEPSAAARLMAEWTASLEASHVPTSPLPDDKPGSTETPADCISSTSESFAKFSPDGSLLKTSRQFSLFQQEEPYCENLPRSGSMRNGELFERPMLAPRIDATGLSSWRSGQSLPYTPQERPAYKTPLPGESSKRYWERMERHERENGIDPTAGSTPWPTPDCNTSSYSNGKFGENLREKAANWPTPRSEDSESCGNHPGAVDSLTGATRQWATPNCRDDHNPSTPDSPRTQRKLEQGWTIDLNEQAAWWTTPQAHDAAGGNPERVGRFGTKHGGANLADDVTLWRTPSAQEPGISADRLEGQQGSRMYDKETGRLAQYGITQQVAMWKTPDVPNGGRTMSAEDVAANGATDKGKRQVGLENQVCHSFHPDQETPPHGSASLPSGPTSRRRLNPNFVDWLMSLPPGWTDYAPVETASWYSRVRMHLESLLKERG